MERKPRKLAGRLLRVFADEARSQGGLDVELEWPGTRAGETGSNGHVLLLPPKACLRDQPVWTRGKWLPAGLMRGGGR